MENSDLAINWGTTFAKDWNYKYFETLKDAERAIFEYYSCTKSVMEVEKVIDLKNFI